MQPGSDVETFRGHEVCHWSSAADPALPPQQTRPPLSPRLQSGTPVWSHDTASVVLRGVTAEKYLDCSPWYAILTIFTQILRHLIQKDNNNNNNNTKLQYCICICIIPFPPSQRAGLQCSASILTSVPSASAIISDRVTVLHMSLEEKTKKYIYRWENQIVFNKSTTSGQNMCPAIWMWIWASWVWCSHIHFLMEQQEVHLQQSHWFTLFTQGQRNTCLLICLARRAVSSLWCFLHKQTKWIISPTQVTVSIETSVMKIMHSHNEFIFGHHGARNNNQCQLWWRMKNDVPECINHHTCSHTTWNDRILIHYVPQSIWSKT